MKRNLMISMLFSAVAACGGEHMRVAVCNIGELPALAIEHAEAEAAYVFQSMGVEIQWTSCGVEVDAADAHMRPTSSCGYGGAGVWRRRATRPSTPWGGRS
jgi:hypothetical protein